MKSTSLSPNGATSSQVATTADAANASGTGSQNSPSQRKGVVTIETKDAPQNFAAVVIKAMVYTNHSGIDPYNDITDKGYDIHIGYEHGGSLPEMNMHWYGLDVDANGHTFAPLTFDPQMGLRIRGRVQSPALGLFHEAEHAWRLISGIFDPRTTNIEDEENSLIRGPETTAARALGEPTRSDHHTGTAELVDDVTYHGISHE